MFGFASFAVSRPARRRRHLVLPAAALAVLSLSASCREPATPRTLSHPTAQNVLPEAALVALVTTNIDDEQARPGLLRVATQFRQATETVVVGTLDGHPETVLGLVADAAYMPDGSILVLDSRMNAVRHYSPQGVLLGRFGSPGDGPEEFRAPNGLEVDPTGLAWVSDRHSMLKRFRLQDGSWELDSTVPMPTVPEAFCIMGDRVFLNGWTTNGGALQELVADTLVGLGFQYTDEDWLIAQELSEGPMGCDIGSDRIVTMFSALNHVFGLTPEGDTAWVSRLDDFRPMRLEQGTGPNGRTSISYFATNSDAGLRVISDNAGTVVLQTGYRTEASIRSGNYNEHFDTYLFDASTGEGLYLGPDFEEIMAVSAQGFVTARPSPFPQFTVWRFAAQETQ